MRIVTNRGSGGILRPDDVCTKTGKPVIEVLQGKHPDARTPDLGDPKNTAFEAYPSLPEVIPLDVTEDDAKNLASRLHGGSGVGGVDAIDFQNWLLHHGKASEMFREEMAAWAEWLANESPPWAAYRALMACRLVALDKCPGVRPVGIGEIMRRFLAKLVLRSVGSQAKDCLLYTSPSPRDGLLSRMPSSA